MLINLSAYQFAYHIAVRNGECQRFLANESENQQHFVVFVTQLCLVKLLRYPTQWCNKCNKNTDFCYTSLLSAYKSILYVSVMYNQHLTKIYFIVNCIAQGCKIFKGGRGQTSGLRRKLSIE